MSFRVGSRTLRADRRQSNQEAKAAFYSFAIFIYVFLMIIASITVFNILNSMNTSVFGKMNQYGVMRVVGMSGKQLQRMVIAEAGTYTVCGCLAGCVLGLPLHSFIFRSMITSHWGVQWQPPLAALAVIVGIAVLLNIWGRYTYRVAISNKRIINIEKDTVSFKWRDYKDNSKQKVMTLSAEEFIRRFLIHILPSGFMKIRQYLSSFRSSFFVP